MDLVGLKMDPRTGDRRSAMLEQQHLHVCPVTPVIEKSNFTKGPQAAGDFRARSFAWHPVVMRYVKTQKVYLDAVFKVLSPLLRSD